MEEQDRIRLINTWIKHHHTQRRTGRVPEETFWAWDEVENVVSVDPEGGLRLILDILETDDDWMVVGNLSAGPLEDLLAGHGPIIIEAVEAEARRNPRFATALGGVWQNRMSDAIWQGVQAVWDRRGWDGIPSGD